MKERKPEASESGDFYLGTLLGRRQAFGLIAARCSAADAACLREIRNQKSYKSLATDWSEFCAKHLGMSQTHANRIIRYLEEFGAEYFELAQLAGVTVEGYRAIAPAVKDQALHYDGQVIALLPENAQRLAEAVEKLRQRGAPDPVEPDAAARLARMERRLSQVAAEINDLSRSEPAGSASRIELVSFLKKARQELERLELELGPAA